MTIMTSFIRLLPAALIATVSAQLKLSCEAPSKGCTYGMWNFDKCLCECIQPFCPDANGDCVLPLDNCGGNPWRDCTRGVDCPWWNSLSTAETCNTGNTVSFVLNVVVGTSVMLLLGWFEYYLIKLKPEAAQNEEEYFFQ